MITVFIPTSLSFLGLAEAGAAGLAALAGFAVVFAGAGLAAFTEVLVAVFNCFLAGALAVGFAGVVDFLGVAGEEAFELALATALGAAAEGFSFFTRAGFAAVFDGCVEEGASALGAAGVD